MHTDLSPFLWIWIIIPWFRSFGSASFFHNFSNRVCIASCSWSPYLCSYCLVLSYVSCHISVFFCDFLPIERFIRVILFRCLNHVSEFFHSYFSVCGILFQFWLYFCLVFLSVCSHLLSISVIHPLRSGCCCVPILACTFTVNKRWSDAAFALLWIFISSEFLAFACT